MTYIKIAEENKMKNNPLYNSVIFAAVFSTVAGFANAELEEVLVTAQKRSESIQDVPVAVTAFTGEDLEARNIQSIGSVADVTPNLLIQSGGTGNNITSVFIRGIGQSSQQVFFDQGVGTYVDGIYRPTAHGGLIDLLNVERIEVLRGPQGDLYGKNAVGGAISIITRQPDVSDTFGSITAVMGSYDRIDVRAFINLPAIEDKLALQFSAASRTADGFVETLALKGDDDLGSQENAAFRAAMKWQITDSAAWTLSYDFMDMESSGSPMHHSKIIPTSRFNAQHNTAVAAGLLGNTPAVTSNFETGDPYKSNITGFQHRNNSEETTIISRLEIDLGIANLVSLTSHKEINTNDGFDADGTPVDVSANNRFVESESFSQEFQLSGLAFNERLNYLVGLYYLSDEIQFNTFAENNISTTPYVGVVSGYRDRSSRNLTDQTLDSYAVFANVSYDISDKFTLTVGGRYMSEEKDMLAGLSRSATTRPARTQAKQSGDWSNFSPKLQIEYAASDDLMVYASFASGFKSGGMNNTIFDDDAEGTFLVAFEEEEVDSYEIGLKGAWLDNTLQTNAALFYMDYTALQVSILDFNPVTGAQLRTIANAGEADIYGIEFESVWAPTEALTLITSAAYLDATYAKNVFEDPSDPDSVLFVDGDPLAFAPEYSVSISGIYEVPVGDGGSLKFRGDYSWRDLVYFEPEGLLEDRINESQDSYGLLNISATYDSGDNWYISVFGTNITDEHYVTGTFIQTRVVGVEWDIVGRPAEWGVKVGYEF